MYKNISIFVISVLFVLSSYAMQTVVPLPEVEILKYRLRQAGMGHFEEKTSFSTVLTEQDQEHTLKHIVATIETAKSSYDNSKLQYKCVVSRHLLIEAILIDNQRALKILKRKGLYQKTPWNIEWDKQ